MLAFCFWPQGACRNLVPQVGIEPRSLAVKAQNLNHQTNREFPKQFTLIVSIFTFRSLSHLELIFMDGICRDWVFFFKIVSFSNITSWNFFFFFFFPLNCFGALSKNQLTVYMCVYFWNSISISLCAYPYTNTMIYWLLPLYN